MTPCVIIPGRGRKADGRVQTTVSGRVRYLYQVRYEEKHGPVPDGFVLHHECEDSRCVNEDHLTLMTQSDHMKLHGFGGDARPGQGRKTHCRSGHEYSEANTYRVSGERRCRICMKANKARYRARLKEAAK